MSRVISRAIVTPPTRACAKFHFILLSPLTCFLHHFTLLFTLLLVREAPLLLHRRSALNHFHHRRSKFHLHRYAFTDFDAARMTLTMSDKFHSPRVIRFPRSVNLISFHLKEWRRFMPDFDAIFNDLPVKIFICLSTHPKKVSHDTIGRYLISTRTPRAFISILQYNTTHYYYYFRWIIILYIAARVHKVVPLLPVIMSMMWSMRVDCGRMKTALITFDIWFSLRFIEIEREVAEYCCFYYF